MKLGSLRHWSTASGAVVAELPPEVGAEQIFAGLGRQDGLLFLDSSSVSEAVSVAGVGPSGSTTVGPLDRFSFLAADPIFSFTLPAAAATAEEVRAVLAEAQRLLEDCRSPAIPGLPPFQGGLAGLISFDAGLAHLGVEPAVRQRAGLALLELGVYDVVYAIDHERHRGWAISQGVPARGPGSRRRRAMERLEGQLGLISGTMPPLARRSAGSPSDIPIQSPAGPSLVPVPPGMVPLADSRGVFSTHTPADYQAMVQAGIDYVRAGDIFQVNLAQQFFVPLACDAQELYRRARQLNPAPFAGFFHSGESCIASMSPERFMKVKGDRVWMHPIKGTRRMLASPEADLWAGADLGASEKDRAENVMIVDLVRNDLARVCRPASVAVEALCRLERFRYVQHLVSVVTGRLMTGASTLDAVLAGFPGGSVTGAPKQRACEIIGELERNARGAYCGSLGYIGFDGAADFNLLIRTFVVGSDDVLFSAGGGITVGSNPAAEYAESLHKAEGMLRAIAAVAGEDSA
jgi:para-aminobenzoate synthetase component 1